jgi:hypothetical protein
VNVNRLAPTGTDGYDPLSNQSQLTGINVEVIRSMGSPQGRTDVQGSGATA